MCANSPNEYRDLRLVMHIERAEMHRFMTRVAIRRLWMRIHPAPTSHLRSASPPPKIVDASSGSPESRFKSPECTSPLRERAPAAPRLRILDSPVRIQRSRIRVQEFKVAISARRIPTHAP